MNTVWPPKLLGGQIGKLEYSSYVPFWGRGDATTLKAGQMNSYRMLLVLALVVAIFLFLFALIIMLTIS